MNSNHNSYELCLAETNAGGILIYIRNNLSYKYKTRNQKIFIYKTFLNCLK